MGLVYKFLIVIGGLLFCSQSFAASDNKHSLSMGWTSFEDSVSGTGASGDVKTLYIEPSGFIASYAYRFSEEIGLSLMYSAPRADENLAQGFQLSRESGSYSVSINYLFENDLSIGASYFYQEKETRVWSPNNQNRYKETYELEELELLILKDWFYNDFSFTPSLSLSYQENQLELSQNFLFRQSISGRLIPVVAGEVEDDNGLYSTVGVDISTFMSISTQLALIPSISVSWIEPLQGSISSTSNYRVFNQSRTTFSSTEDDYEELSGQGVLGLGALLLFDRLSVSSNYSRPISGNDSQHAWSVSIGIDF